MPSDVVERLSVYRQAREFCFDDAVAQFVDGGAGRDGDHVRTRRHHVAHALFAEFNDLFDEARFILLDDAFLGCCVDEGFDRLLLGGGRGGFILRKAQNGSEKTQDRIERPREPQEQAHERDERTDPSPARASQKQERQKLHCDHHFGGEEDHDLESELGPAGNGRVHSERRNGGQKHQPEACDEAEGERSARAIELEARLDFGFKRNDVIADAAGRHASPLAIDAVEVGDHDEPNGENDDAERVKDNDHGLYEPERAAEALLAAIHLAGIGFMIVAHQVQDAMKDQDAHFVVQGASEAAGVAARDVGSNGDIPEIGSRGGRGSRGCGGASTAGTRVV